MQLEYNKFLQALEQYRQTSGDSSSETIYTASGRFYINSPYYPSLTIPELINDFIRERALLRYLNYILKSKNLTPVRMHYHSISAKQNALTTGNEKYLPNTRRTRTTNVYINMIKINEGVSNFKQIFNQEVGVPENLKAIHEYFKKINRYYFGINYNNNFIDIYTTDHTKQFHQQVLCAIPLIYSKTAEESSETFEEEMAPLIEEFASFENLATEDILKHLTAYYTKAVTEYTNKAKNSAMQNFLESMRKNSRKGIISQEKAIKDNIADYERRLALLYKDLQTNYTMQTGLTEVQKTLEEDLNKAIASNKQITLNRCVNDILNVTVTTFLNNYDPRPVGNIALQRFASKVIAHAFKKLFSDGTYNLKIKQSFQLDLACNNVYANDNNSRTSQGILTNNQGLPGNPHLVYYSCFGQNRGNIIKAIESANFYGLFAALTSCAASINFYDPGPTRHFCELFRDMCYNAESFKNIPLIYDREQDIWYDLPEFIELCKKELHDETNQTEQSEH